MVGARRVNWVLERLSSLGNQAEISGSLGGSCGRILGTWIFVWFGQHPQRECGGNSPRGAEIEEGG